MPSAAKPPGQEDEVGNSSEPEREDGSEGEDEDGEDADGEEVDDDDPDDDFDDGEDSDDESSTRSFPIAKTPMNSLVSLVEEKEDVTHKPTEWYSSTGKQPEQLASVREVEEEDYMDIEEVWEKGDPVSRYGRETGKSGGRPSYPPIDMSSVPRMPYSPTTSGAFEVPRGSIGGSSTGLSAGTTSTAGRTISSLHSQAALLFSRRNKKASGGSNKDLGNLFDLTSNRSQQSRRPKNGLPALEPLKFLRPNGNNEEDDRIDLHRDVERGVDPFGDGATPKDLHDPAVELGTNSQHSSDNKSYADPIPLAVLDSADQNQKSRDQRRLEQLGYSQDLGRDYGFWASFSVGFCNIGGLQGSLFGIFTTFSYGGPQ